MQASVRRPSPIVVEIPGILDGIPDGAEIDDDEHFVAATCANIDEAMASLHSLLDGMNVFPETPSSYIPSIEYDWLLDGLSSWETDAALSQQFCEKLYAHQYETMEQSMSRTAREFEQQQEAEEENFHKDNIENEEIEQEQAEDESFRKDDVENDEIENGDDFGEFQSAEIPTTIQSMSKEEQAIVSPCDHDETYFNLINNLSDQAEDGDEQEDSASSRPDDCCHNTNTFLVANAALTSNLSSHAVPLSLRLPISDMSTIENRFVRRLQQKIVTKDFEYEDESETGKDAQFDAECLIEQYGGETDETADVLKRLPWKFVPYWKCHRLLQHELDERYVPVMHEHLTTELSTLDSALAQVNAQLLQQIQPHKAELYDANEVVHRLHQDTALALMYVNRGLESVKQTRGDREACTGIEGTIALVEAWDLRDKFIALDHILNKVAHLLESEKLLVREIESFDPERPNAMDDCRRIVKFVRDLNAEANDNTMAEIGALDPLRERALSAVDLFRNRIDVLLNQVISRSSFQGIFWKDAYETLLLAKFEVEQQQMINDHSDSLKIAATWASLSSLWSQTVIKTLCVEVDRAFARALLDPSDFRESLYDKELMELSLEMGHDRTDAARLRTVTHNLLTIRFNFEAEEYYLPWVYRKLCALLTDVLHTIYCLLNWHDSRCEPIDQSGVTDNASSSSWNTSMEFNRLLANELKIGISALWKHCEDVLVRCLDEYLHLATKTKFFHGDDDRNWARDLECLHEVLQLTHQFLGIGRGFLQLFQLEGVDIATVASKDETPLQRKLCDIFRRHLRCVHVEAMNTFGARLAREEWRFVTLSCKNDLEPATDQVIAIKKLLSREIKQKSALVLKKFSPKFRLVVRSDVRDSASLFSEYDVKKNPFLRDDLKGPESSPADEVATDDFDLETCDANPYCPDAYTHLGPLFTMGETDFRLRSCKAVVEVLPLWYSRLLTITRLLPLIAEDVSVVFAHLCDLYLTTVLRLCAKNAKNEKIILGVVSPSPVVTSSPKNIPQRSGSLSNIDQPLRSSPIFGFRRRQQPLPKQPVVRSLAMVSATTEADACYPPLDDMGMVTKLRKFLLRAQESLGNVVNFDMVNDWLPDVKVKESEKIEATMKLVSVILEKRVCAAMSALVVAALLDVVRSDVVKLCRSSSTFDTTLGTNGGISGDDAVAAFCSYVDMLLLVVPKFVDVTTQISCAHAVCTRLVVSEMISVGGGWEEAKLNEHPNDYVDDVCLRFSLLWANLQPSASKLPFEIVRSLWENLVQAGFLALLEGFSRVMHCSTEGRSLMTMDLAAFVSGTEPWALWERIPNHEEFSPPPSVTIKRGAQYVDTFIKMFYFPLEDIKTWIESNFTNYQQNHTIALVSGAGNSNALDRQEIIRFVKNLYLNYRTKDGHEDPPSLCRHATC